MAIKNYKAFIEREVCKIPDKFSPQTADSGDMWMFCCYHDQENLHLSTKRSLKINLSNSEVPYGSFFCFACAKHGTWNKIAKKLKLKRLKADELYEDDFKDELSETDLQKLGFGSENSISKEEFLLAVSIEWDKAKKWRRIKGKLVNNIGGRLMLNELTKTLQLALPVKVDDQLQGVVYCRLKKEPGKLSYINEPGVWSKNSLFPYDYIDKNFKKYKYVVLVEGPRDALFLIQNGIPALSILGTHSWSKTCANLVMGLSKDLVVVMFDGDYAGRKAKRKVSRHLKSHCSILNINLPEDVDPAKLKAGQIEKIKAAINKKLKEKV